MIPGEAQPPPPQPDSHSPGLYSKIVAHDLTRYVSTHTSACNVVECNYSHPFPVQFHPREFNQRNRNQCPLLLKVTPFSTARVELILILVYYKKMNIVKLFLLTATVLTACLPVLGAQVNCIALILNHCLHRLLPVGTYLQIGIDGNACLRSSNNSPPPPTVDVVRCVQTCNVNSPNQFLGCLGVCLNPNFHLPAACDALIVDLVALATSNIKVVQNVFDGIDLVQCAPTLLNLFKGINLSPPPPTTTVTSTSSCSTPIPATITCSPGDVQPTVVPWACCFQNLCSGHPVQCGCLCSCTS